MHLTLRTAFAAVALVASTGTAFAQSVELDGTVSTDDASGDDQFTLPQGKLFINGIIGINLSEDAAFKPVSISPDIYYGVTNDLTLGLVHSGLGATGIIGSVGQSLCVTGEDNGCGEVYNNVGLDARYRVAAPFAINAGLYVGDFDPFALQLKAGVLAGHRWGKFGLETNPNVFIGLTERDTGNKEVLSVPVTASVQATPAFAVNAQAGLVTPFSDAGDLWRLSVAVGARFRVSEHLDLGAAFALPLLAGGLDDGTGADARTLTLGVGYAL